MDLRYAARHLVHHPRFAVAAIATLALGIGATSAVYAVVDAVYLKPPPYSDPDRIVSIRVRVPGHGSWGIAAGTMTAVAQLPVVQQAAVAITSEHTLSGGDRPLLVSGEAVSGEFFAVLGVQAAIGRTLSSGEDPDTSPIVLGHALWRRSFGADPAVLGRSILLNDVAHTVIGVMPASFRTLEEAEYWTLLHLRSGDLAQTGRGPFDGYARLWENAHRAARSQAAAASTHLAPIDGHAAEIELAPIADGWASVSRTTLLTLLGAVSLVLLIACANVANLLLAKGQARRPELAVRAALGATRGRLVRQLLVEALVLASAAAAAGLALAWVLLRVLFTIAVPDVARISEAAVDWRTAAFTAAVAAASVVLFGMAPAVATAWRGRPALTPQRTASSRGGRRLSQLLIGLEVALTLALFAAGVTMLGRFHALLSIETGFDTADLHVVTLRPSGIPYPDTAAFYTRVVTSLQQAEGVQAAAISRMPLQLLIPSPVQVLDDSGGNSPGTTARMRIVSAGAFRVLGVPILRGREIDLQDHAGAERVAMINERLAAHLPAGRDPLGSVVSVMTIDGKRELLRIVGIVRDFRDSFYRETRPELYTSAAQFPSTRAHIVVKSEADPARVLSWIQRAVEEADPRQAISEPTTAKALVAARTAYIRFLTTLVTGFAGLALILVFAGIASVVAASVSSRMRELGIRVSLGAGRRDLAALLVRDIAPAVLAGLVVGALAAHNLSYVLVWLSAGVQRIDLDVYAATSVGLLVVAALAVWAPLRDAWRIDPAVVLRLE